VAAPLPLGRGLTTGVFLTRKSSSGLGSNLRRNFYSGLQNFTFADQVILKLTRRSCQVLNVKCYRELKSVQRNQKILVVV
jgi:hypothetical protein